MKVYSDVSKSSGTSHSSSAMPSTVPSDPVHSSGGASATGMKQAVSVGHQSPALQSTQNEAPVSPMMQQEHGSLEAKLEMLKPDVLEPDVLEPDVLEPEDLKMDMQKAEVPKKETVSQANPPEELSLMHHPENMPDCSSQIPLTFQMLGLPSGSTTLTGSQQQLLVSVLYHALQVVLEDTTQVESKATNPRDMNSQGDSSNEAFQRAAVTVETKVSETMSGRSVNLPRDETEHVTMEKIPVTSTRGEKGMKTEQKVKSASPGTPTEASADMGDTAGEQSTNHHGYPGHMQLHGDQTPSHGNAPALPAQDSLIPDDPEYHDTETNESHFYENGEIQNKEGATDSESEFISDFRFQNSPSESII